MVAIIIVILLFYLRRVSDVMTAFRCLFFSLISKSTKNILLMPGLTLLKTARELSEKHAFSEPRLREAIPYIKAFSGKKIVLKIGGSVLNDLSLLPYLVSDIVFMKNVGIKVVLVHGGSRQLNQAMLDKELSVQHVDGLRVTSAEVLNLAASVFCDISVKIKNEIEVHGYKCAIFDRNSGLVKSKLKDSKLGFVGEPQSVDTSKIDLLGPDVIPVVSAITSGIEPGDIGFNVNADDVAGILASSLKTEKLILMTDVDGVMDENGQLISSLTVSEVHRLIGEGVIHGGMIPKVNTCLKALKGGAGKCHIIRGGVDSFINEILTDKGVGTEFISDKNSVLSSAV